MANTINPTTPQLKAVKNFAEAYLTRDVKNLEPVVSRDFQFQTFPKIADHPDESKEAHFERYGPLLTLMTKVEMTFHEVIEAPGKVILHVSVMLWTIDGAEIDYDTLTILTLTEEDGELKVAKFQDFSDPEKRGNLHGWVAKTLASKGAT